MGWVVTVTSAVASGTTRGTMLPIGSKPEMDAVLVVSRSIVASHENVQVSPIDIVPTMPVSPETYVTGEHLSSTTTGPSISWSTSQMSFAPGSTMASHRVLVLVAS